MTTAHRFQEDLRAHPNEDGDRFIEIWNLVFMQFEQVSVEERIELPKPSIDTGMGLERIAAVMQGTHDNYGTDMMQALMAASADKSGAQVDGPYNVSHRVIADHLRSCAFLIADGVLPSNEGRGYVLRRIMRARHATCPSNGMSRPSDVAFNTVSYRTDGQAFPELVRATALITETLKLEETRFKKLLDRGLKLLDDVSDDIEEGGEIDGEVAFRSMIPTVFRFDLTQDALRSRGVGVDIVGFDVAMERQRAEARKAWTGSGDLMEETIWFDIRDELGATEFFGYETDQSEGR